MLNLRNSSVVGGIGGLLLCFALTSGSVWFLPLAVRGQAAPTADCNTNNLLLVVSSLNLAPGDAALAAHLTQQGFQLAIKTGKAVVAADANGQALIIVSESVTSSDVGSEFREVAVPALTWEGWIFDNMRMTGLDANKDYGEMLPETQIHIVDPNHPLAAGLSGDVALLTSVSTAEERKFHWGIPGKQAAVVAISAKNNNYAHIFAYEKGATMVGLAAPARRVGFPNGSAHRFTAEGWRLFDAAVAWAKACSSASPATPTPEQPTATPDPLVTPSPTFISTTPPTMPATTVPPATATPTATTRPRPGVTPSATPTGSPAQLSVVKSDFLYTDADQNELVSAGDTMLYTIKISNLGGRSALQLRLVDPPDPNSTLLIGSVTSDSGAVVKGNTAGDAHVVIEVPELTGGDQVLISFQAQVNTQNSAPNLQNQAITTFVEQIPEPRSQTTVVSDDPDTPSGPDTTVTVLNAPLAQLNQKLFMPLLAK